MSAEGAKPLRRFLLVLAMCVVLGALGGLLVAELQQDPEARPRFIPPREEARDFRLRDEDGKWRTLAGERGNAVVLTFLYSTCWDLCPAQAAEIVDAVEQVGEKGVTVYVVSVDPIADTRTRVREWLAVRQLEDAPMHFLIGSKDELAPVWQTYGIVPVNASPEDAAAAAKATDEFRAYAAAEGLDLAARPYERPERSAPIAARDPYPDTRRLTYRGRTRHEQGLEFEHSAYVLLIDKRGVQRLGIPFERLNADELAQDLRVLIAEP